MKFRDAKSVLVTGVSGFIGQHLVRRLIERGRPGRTPGPGRQERRASAPQRSAGPGCLLRGGGARSDVCRTGAGHGQGIGKEAGHGVVHMPGPLVPLVGLCGNSLGLVRQPPGWVNSDKMAEALAGSWTCSSAKARTQLGWSPAATLAERLRETAQWYRQAGWL